MVNKRVYEEYEKLGFEYNDFTPGDLRKQLDAFIGSGLDIRTANILLILAIRDAHASGGRTNLSVGKTVETWIARGITNADQAKEYVEAKRSEKEQQQAAVEELDIPLLTEQQILEIDWMKYR